MSDEQNNSEEPNSPNIATRIRIALAGLIQVTLLIAALWDLYHRDAEQIKGSKWMWTPIVFINFIGPLAYFRFGRKQIAADADV